MLAASTSDVSSSTINSRGFRTSVHFLLKEFASFCLCVLCSGRSTVHAETPSSRICDKRFFHCGPYPVTVMF